jgi:hypothetical protein
MPFSSLLSLLFLLYLSSLTYPSISSSKLKGNLKCEYDRSLITKDLWLKGESAPVPFGSQLFAVYSWVPVSFILKSNLILGDLYTRKALPQHTWSKGDGHNSGSHSLTGGSNNAGSGGGNTHSSPGMIMFPLPFGSFFDVKYFINYWSQHKLPVISLQDYEVCFNSSSPNSTSAASSATTQGVPSTESQLQAARQLTRIKRNPDFYPIAKSDYPRLLTASDIKLPIQEHQTFTFDSPHRMIALYPFFDDPTMLQYVHSSLRPSLQISRVVKAILKELPSGFIAMHVRADSEALSADTLLQQQSHTVSQLSKQDRKKALVAHIMNSHCLQEIAKFDNAFIDPPAVYLATNTFHFHPSRRSRKAPGSTHTSSLGHHPSVTAANRTSTMSSEDRLKFLTSELAELGFHVIHTKTTLMEKLTMNLLEKSFEFKEIGDPTLIRRLLPEQLSYVDMLISRASTCFIPSHIPSTFSYLIQRMRNLDNKKYEKYEEINNSTYGSLSMYRDWGM